MATDVRTTPLDEPAIFSWGGIVKGIGNSVPLLVGVFAYGLVFGVLARQTRLSFVEAVLMSALVNAGSSQFVALDMWHGAFAAPAIIFTTLVVNLRHLLMGAALAPWLRQVHARLLYPALFTLGDESWALTVREQEANGRDRGFLLGSGIAMYTTWVSATAVGYLAAANIPDPDRWGLDFAFTATFITLVVGMWKGRATLLPWLVAGIVALLAERLLGGKWYILLGGLAGSLTGALRDDD